MHARQSDHMKAVRMLRRHGYATGGEVSDEAEDKRLVRKAVRQHETAEHAGRHVALKLKRGGAVHGEHPRVRADKRARQTFAEGTDIAMHKDAGPKGLSHPAERGHARGGRAGGGRKGTTVNVMVAHPPSAPGGMLPIAGRPTAMPPPAAVSPPRPVPAPMPAGGAPIGGAGGMPMARPVGAMRRGGGITAGAKSGLGRLQKARMAGRSR